MALGMGERSEKCPLKKKVGFIDRCKNNVLIIKNRHPDARKASARSHQRASRSEGPCVLLTDSWSAQGVYQVDQFTSDESSN